MTVTTTSTVSGPYYPNGSTTVFPFDFKTFSADEIQVISVANGEESIVDPSLYAATIGDPGGSITFSSPPASGPALYVRGNPSFEQQIAFALEGAFLPQVHDEAFDRSALRDLYLKDRVERTLMVAEGDTPLPVASLAGADGKVLGIVAGEIVPIDNDPAEASQAVADAEAAAADAAASSVSATGQADRAEDEANQSAASAANAGTFASLASSASLASGAYPNSAETTVPADVGAGKTYWAASADSLYLKLWSNTAGSPAAVNNPDGSQVKIPNSSVLANTIFPRALGFGSYKPVHDPTGRFGTTNALYAPRTIYTKRGNVEVSTSTAGPAASTELPTHVKLTYATGVYTFHYFDCDDLSYHSVAYASGTIAMPSKALDKIVPLGVTVGTLFVSACDFIKAEDYERPLVVFTAPPVVDNNYALIPAYYYRGEGNAYVLVSPAVPAGFTTAPAYTKIGVTPASVTTFWHDEKARQASQTCIKSTIGNAAPNQPSYLGAVLLRTVNGVVTSPWSAVTGESNAAPNQYSYTRDPSGDPNLKLYGTSAIVSVTDSAVTALGITKGVADATNKVPGIDITLPDPRGAGRMFLRMIVITGTANNFGSPNIAVFSADGSWHQTFVPTIEEQLSTTAAIFSCSVAVPDRADLGFVRFDNVNTGVSATICGFQFHNGPQQAWWIRRGDKPTKPSNEAAIAALQTQVQDPAIDMLCPVDLHFIAGRKRPLYTPALMTARSEGQSYLATFSSLGAGNVPYVLSERDTIDLDPDRMGSTGSLVMRRASDPDGRLVQALNLHVAPATGTGALATALIGDSIINRGQPPQLVAKLNAMGFTTTAVGTINNNGALGEGREGHRFSDYVYTTTDKEQPVTDVAAYLALSDAAKIGYNPFIRPTVSGDNPDYVQNGYIFDYAFYLSRFSLTNPTHVIIALGTNDVGLGPNAAAQIALGAQIMYAQIRAALPDAQIAFMTYGLPRGAVPDARWATQVSAWIRPVANFVKTQADAKLKLIPAHLFTSPEANWQMTTASTDADFGYATATVGTTGDSIPLHPDPTGQHQLSDATAAWVAATA